MYGHFSKYVRTNAIRIDSTTTNPSGKEGLKLHHVAFVNEATARGEGNAGATVVVVVNPEFKAQALELRCGADVVDATLPAKSLATFRWQGSRCV
jgi:O-glycosyl hydrolase